jgi:hypothetical protein
MRETLHRLGSFEGNVVQELESVDVHVQGSRRDLAIPGQMEKKAAHLLLPHLLWGPHIMPGEMAGATQVCPLRVLAVGLKDQILFHLIV